MPKTSTPAAEPQTLPRGTKYAHRATRAGTFQPKADIVSFLDSTTREIGGVWGAYSEACINSDDALAPHVKITVTKRGDDLEVEILDDGEGAGAEGRQSFMDVARSSRRGSTRTTGRHGLGVKRMRADFRFIEVVDLFRKRAGDRPHAWAFDWDEYTKYFAGEGPEGFAFGTLEEDDERALRKDLDLAPDATGFYLRLWGCRGRRFTVDEMRRHLAKHLPPWVAEKVLVRDGREGEWLPLATRRELIGDLPITREIVNDPKLGKITARLYVPAEKTESDVLRIGGTTPICTFLEFYEQLPETLQQEVPAVFRDPYVCGDIYVEAFGEFRSGSSKSFTTDLFSSEKGLRLLQHFVLNFLKLDLGDEVEQKLGIVQDQKTEEHHQRLVRDAVDFFGAPGGTGPRPAKAIELADHYVEVAPGEIITVRVRRYADSIRRLVWDAGQSGGKVTPTEGPEVQYTAGPLPRGVPETTHVLVVADGADRDTYDELVIVKVREKKLRIRPDKRTLQPRSTLPFEAQNWQEHGAQPADLEWTTNEPGATIEPRRGMRVEYTTGRREGLYELRVTHRHQRRVSATAVVENSKEKKRGGGGGGGGETTGDVFLIEGQRYRLDPLRAKIHPSGLLAWEAGTRGNVTQIQLNTADPVYDGIAGGYRAQFQLVINEVLLWHVQLKNRGRVVSLDEVRREMYRLRSEFIKRRAQAREAAR